MRFVWPIHFLAYISSAFIMPLTSTMDKKAHWRPNSCLLFLLLFYGNIYLKICVILYQLEVKLFKLSIVIYRFGFYSRVKGHKPPLFIPTRKNISSRVRIRIKRTETLWLAKLNSQNNKKANFLDALIN